MREGWSDSSYSRWYYFHPRRHHALQSWLATAPHSEHIKHSHISGRSRRLCCHWFACLGEIHQCFCDSRNASICFGYSRISRESRRWIHVRNHFPPMQYVSCPLISPIPAFFVYHPHIKSSVNSANLLRCKDGRTAIHITSVGSIPRCIVSIGPQPHQRHKIRSSSPIFSSFQPAQAMLYSVAISMLLSLIDDCYAPAPCCMML